MNLTSNEHPFLYQDRHYKSEEEDHRVHALHNPLSTDQMYKLVILYCDNDGVWPLDASPYRGSPSQVAFVPGEFERAINEHNISPNQVRRLVQDGKIHRFV